MEKKKSEFDKVFSAWDILVIAFGAMIGWGWVVSTGDWIGRGGVLGAVIGFAIGGIIGILCRTYIMQNLLQQCHSVEENMYLVTRQWDRLVHLSVRGRSF